MRHSINHSSINQRDVESEEKEDMYVGREGGRQRRGAGT
jgi:hypothetical protein